MIKSWANSSKGYDCAECGDSIYTCDSCGEYFSEKQDVYCCDDGVNHYCLECGEEISRQDKQLKGELGK